MRISILSLLCFLAALPVAHAQTPSAAQTDPAAAEQAAEVSPPKEPVPDAGQEASLAARITSQNEELQQALRRIEQLENQARERTEDGADDAEFSDETVEEGTESGPAESKVGLHGFFDLTFTKKFLPKDSSLGVFLDEHSTFLMTNLNLIASAQMSPSLSAMVEVRLVYMPYGQEIGPTVYTADGVQVAEYERNDERYLDPLTTQYVPPNGLHIERAQLSWAPREWFRLLLGKYLTPFGIWNTDHSPTVVIPVHIPYMQVRRMVPLDQLGAQITGRVFARYDFYWDYYLTISNGRSSSFQPGDVGDMDENKALGAGIAATYEASKWMLRLGGYGYYGSATNRSKSVTLTSSGGDMIFDAHDDFAADEMIVSAYALLELFGLRLQTECVKARIEYTIPGPLVWQDRILITNDLTSEVYGTASYNGFDVYGMIAYTLPLESWLKTVRVIPFFFYEYSRPQDTQTYQNMDLWVAGLNIRPSPWVALKFEYLRSIPESKRIGRPMTFLTGQVAVSF